MADLPVPAKVAVDMLAPAEATAIGVKLAADRALGLITRAQLITATRV